jgi:hypothetical protein
MSDARQRRKLQLAQLLHSADGRQEISKIYRRVCLPPGDERPLKKSFRRMAAEILAAEYPPQPPEPPVAGPEAPSGAT